MEAKRICPYCMGELENNFPAVFMNLINRLPERVYRVKRCCALL